MKYTKKGRHGNKMENHPYLENSNEIAENVNYSLTHDL